ncbi:hypothetical protein [Hydrogenophaga sp. 5NK40-0174]|uniref:hypothetical protein n=1 Tax=Hydrogenophaga sp. 5NK40-0174 TaxID=3127649 RepID=UPI003101CFBA
MTEAGLTPDHLRKRVEELASQGISTFKTHGLSEEQARQFLKTSEGEAYLQRVIEAGKGGNAGFKELYDRAVGQITSGREFPRVDMNSEALVKIVPAGSKPSTFTPYWAREADLDAAIREGKNLQEFFGLPVTSEAAKYDVYRLTPNAPTEVWVSTVAPVSELDGEVRKPGGATQYLTPNRGQYTMSDEPIRTVDNRLRVPLRDLERSKQATAATSEPDLNAPHRTHTPDANAAAEAHGGKVNASAVRGAVKVAGAAGTVYGALDAKNQVDAAIDTARSTREQWIKGTEEAANQGAKTVVTGSAATVGAIPGAAAGALTSPVTGPAGPIVGGLATGGAAAYGAEKLYEDSRLQQFAKYVGRQAGDLGYDYVSADGRALRQVNSLTQDLREASSPAERARIQARLDVAADKFNVEVERNNRYFQGREKIDQVWEKMHERIPKVDKDDVVDALARHIDAGKKPADAMRGAFSDAVHEKYPRALHHEPLDNYSAMSNEQLTDRYRQYRGEVAQDRQKLQALEANTDSHNNVDQGWPRPLAVKRQAERVENGRNELWRDEGHVRALREEMRERGMPVEPARPSPTSAVPQLSPEQQRYQAQAQSQLGPAMQRAGWSEAQMERVTTAAAIHASAKAQGGGVSAFHLSKDGERVAMIQSNGALSEFNVQDALKANQPVEQQAQAPAQEMAQAHQAQQAAEQAQAADVSAMAR